MTFKNGEVFRSILLTDNSTFESSVINELRRGNVDIYDKKNFKDLYILLTVKMYNEKSNQFYERTLVYPDIVARECVLRILAISMNYISIISIKEEKGLCLLNNLQDDIKELNRIDRYWADGVLSAITIVDKEARCKSIYVVTKPDVMEYNSNSSFSMILNSGEKLYLEELKDCWVLKNKWYAF
ncbi:hypothetical protein IGJ41_002737 [Enterococcus sp. DIV1537a]|uniref:hypothetical protein n=1 Tax=Enterococcus sp. DIV1537a TaxID=2774733 RepID=UPI003F201962